ncbi:sulfate transporter [Klebsiella pneumoniae]|uniref:Sulfate transporter n=1 Tax=Klebsiella pneumoniae TaxID=573 RepID=A0A377W246_KLEPN|nr:sulfate transporter [Klebsiella pneumoniae]
MGAAFWWLFTRLGSWIPSLMSHVPDWLQWLNYLLWPVVVLSILLVFGYFFSTIGQLDSRAVQRPAGGTAGKRA